MAALVRAAAKAASPRRSRSPRRRGEEGEGGAGAFGEDGAATSPSRGRNSPPPGQIDRRKASLLESLGGPTVEELEEEVARMKGENKKNLQNIAGCVEDLQAVADDILDTQDEQMQKIKDIRGTWHILFVPYGLQGHGDPMLTMALPPAALPRSLQKA